jgi:choline dehydrogenase-like flavoprotein
VLDADLAVVGAGPAGIVTALEVANAGFDVVLVESGERRYRPEIQRLADAAAWDPHRHAPMSMATRRQVGGASVIWGGRCVPFDPVDFEPRSSVRDSSWPLTYGELLPFFQRACDWLRCGRAVFDAREIEHLACKTLVPGLGDGDTRASSLERWSLPTNFGREYASRLKQSGRIRLVTGLSCTEVVRSPGDSHVELLEARTLDGKGVRIRARRYVIACGGLETTRLLLASRRGPRDEGLGNHSGHLGRWYMGHLEGVVANVRFTTPSRDTIYGYEQDADGVYVRRRLSFSREFILEEQLPNIVAWLANPPPADPTHDSGPLSFAYLALASSLGPLLAPDAQRRSLTGDDVPGAPYAPTKKGPVHAHLQNILRELGPTARFVGGFGYRRFIARRRVPGFFIRNSANVYPLQYHGEHLPNADSRVTLADERDAVGMPRLRIDLRFSPEDIDGVIRAHRCWDAYLRSSGCGRLEYLAEDVEAAIGEQAGGGFHQMGTTRMSVRQADGVVTPQLAVHGFDDLFVASSSAFVTASQANSTFMVIVLALRLADHLRSALAR